MINAPIEGQQERESVFGCSATTTSNVSASRLAFIRRPCSHFADPMTSAMPMTGAVHSSQLACA
jgi:hypothetical protein